jgi:pimeloyl-ACP methyl ester carboxylesterase
MRRLNKTKTKRTTRTRLGSTILLSAAVLATIAGLSRPAMAADTLPTGFKEATQPVGNGVSLHYVRGGSGDPVVLIHGFTDTSRMWRPILTELGAKYTVITPDLPGLGGSSFMPSGQYDMKSVARNIHELVKRLGYTRIRLVGHDIGMMAAYAYAAQYPQEVQKLILMDAPLPGIGETWDKSYSNAARWHFHFVFSPIALKLVEGRERIFLDHFWITFSGDPNAVAVPEADRQEYAREYAKKGAMAAGLGYFKAFPIDAEDNNVFQKAGKLPMPVLVLEGERAMGGALTEQAHAVAVNVQSVVFKGAGHWLMEERPTEIHAAIITFFQE